MCDDRDDAGREDSGRRESIDPPTPHLSQHVCCAGEAGRDGASLRSSEHHACALDAQPPPQRCARAPLRLRSPTEQVVVRGAARGGGQAAGVAVAAIHRSPAAWPPSWPERRWHEDRRRHCHHHRLHRCCCRPRAGRRSWPARCRRAPSPKPRPRSLQRCREEPAALRACGGACSAHSRSRGVGIAGSVCRGRARTSNTPRSLRTGMVSSPSAGADACRPPAHSE